MNDPLVRQCKFIVCSTNHKPRDAWSHLVSHALHIWYHTLMLNKSKRFHCHSTQTLHIAATQTTVLLVHNNPKKCAYPCWTWYGSTCPKMLSIKCCTISASLIRMFNRSNSSSILDRLWQCAAIVILVPPLESSFTPEECTSIALFTCNIQTTHLPRRKLC